MQEPKEYSFSLRLLNIEVFAVKFTTTAESKSWLGLLGLTVLLGLGTILLIGKPLLTLFGLA